jgi:LytS/YehU family sensor histidine kinase
MNPHFIFNVLSSIQNLVKKDAKAASKFITKFSRLLRTVLENSRQNFVPLEDEIEVLKNYLDLQKLRFPDLFDYQIEMDDALEGRMIAIPPMLIQPFVENAIEHGFKGIERQGLIEIRLTNNKSASDNYINCCIVDNGIGYQMNPTTTKKSASVELISSFIKKATGTAIRISYRDQEKSTGTAIQFKIPTN